jgi:hypothetical protein
MPYDEAERNIRLFAGEVMPALQKLGPAPTPAPVTADTPPAAGGTSGAARATSAINVGMLGS